jgi:hypothetical protein
MLKRQGLVALASSLLAVAAAAQAAAKGPTMKLTSTKRTAAQPQVFDPGAPHMKDPNGLDLELDGAVRR